MIVAQPVVVNSPAPTSRWCGSTRLRGRGSARVAPVYRVSRTSEPRRLGHPVSSTYVSANAQITSDDTPVQIIKGATGDRLRQVQLAAGDVSATTI